MSDMLGTARSAQFKYSLASCSLVLVCIFISDGVRSPDVQGLPLLIDSSLAVEKVNNVSNMSTGMDFLGPNDLLTLDQYNGTVWRVKDGKVLSVPVLDVNVGQPNERGLLGIEIMQQESGSPFVFLYYTEALSRDGGTILGSRLYRYTFSDDSKGGKLINGSLLLDLPGITNTPTTRTVSGDDHYGGKILIGPDNNIYLTTGDMRRKTKAQNFISGSEADGSGGILRVTPQGVVVGRGILGSHHPLDKYFAYGIRNSFGMDFDPVSGSLWATENGPAQYR